MEISDKKTTDRTILMQSFCDNWPVFLQAKMAGLLVCGNWVIGVKWVTKNFQFFLFLHLLLLGMASTLAWMDSSLISWGFSIGNHCSFPPLETKGNTFQKLGVSIVWTSLTNSLRIVSPLLQFTLYCDLQEIRSIVGSLIVFLRLTICDLECWLGGLELKLGV